MRSRKSIAGFCRKRFFKGLRFHFFPFDSTDRQTVEIQGNPRAAGARMSPLSQTDELKAQRFLAQQPE